MRRRTRLVAVVPALGLAAALSGLSALSACAPFHAGAAATVGDTRISTTTLRDVVDREQTAADAYAQSGSASASGAQQATPVAAEQRALAELVQIELLKSVAATLHATVAANAVGLERNQIVSSEQGATEEQVRQIGAYSGVDLDLFSQFRAYLDATSTAAAPSDADVTAFTSLPDHRVAQVERVDIPTLAAAQQFTDAVRQQPGSFDTDVQSAGGSASTLVYTARALAAMAPGMAITEGGIVGPIRVNDGDFAVLSVTVVRNDSTSVALDTGSLDRSALTEERFDTTYQAAVRRLGVHVSPRFGAWTFPTADGLGTIGDLPPVDQLSKAVSTPTSPAPSAAGS